MSEPVTLPASCPQCGGPVWLELSPPDPEPVIQFWTCPYCAKVNDTKIDGTILWVAKRYRETLTHD
jgi:hypothetical protein